MPHILHVITSHSWGGLEMYVLSLIREQASSGMAVEVYCIQGTPIARELSVSGIPLHYGKRESHFSPVDILRIRKLCRKRDISIVHSHTRFDVWATSLALMGTKVGHVHSTYMVVAPKRDLYHWLIYRRVDAITSSSSFANQKIANDLPIPKAKIKLIRYGRHLEKFVRSEVARNTVRQQLDIGENDIVFGMVGRIDPAKGIQEFAESLLELSPEVRAKAKYLIIGERNEASFEELGAWLEAYQQRAEVREHLKVIPFQKDIVPYLNALDCLVLASYCEMYALSVLEAMAMSLPVIGTNSEGTPEQVADGRGTLVEPHSSKSIAAAITHYIEHPDLLQLHGANGYAWVHSEHEMAKTIQSFKALYAEIGSLRTPVEKISVTPDTQHAN